MRNKKKIHGHSHLISYLNDSNINFEGKTLIEIGTTRERHNTQDSSLIFAKYCNLNKINFTTVDMDMENTENIIKRCDKNGLKINAVTEKGEDYLEKYENMIDIIYLDAFDFYHNNHSQKRVNKYKNILNTEITNENCWKMHYDCAVHLVDKMNMHGIVCFDDILDDTEYQGKGKTAIPYLLDNGFETIKYVPNSIILKKVK